jgi:hypothetical protein
MQPKMILRITICHISITPVSARIARIAAWTNDKIWVISKTLYLLNLSIITPATGDRRNVGICPAKPTSPRRNADPVMWYTSHGSAMRCIQVPMREIL